MLFVICGTERNKITVEYQELWILSVHMGVNIKENITEISHYVIIDIIMIAIVIITVVIITLYSHYYHYQW